MNRYFWPILSLLVAAGLQGNLPARLELLGAKPDLILVVLVAYSLSAGVEFGAFLGFVAGLIHGSAVGVGVGSFIVTRTIVGLLAGLATARLFSDSPIVTAASTVALTLACELMFLLANPRPLMGSALVSIVGECVWNVLLALVFYSFARRLRTRRKIRLAIERARF